MTLVASAPAPAMPTLTPRLPAAASAAALELAWIVAFSLLVTEMSPAVVVTPWLALAMYASTSLLIWFCAIDRPMAIEMATLLSGDRASENASAAAAALASMDEVSAAPKLTLPALMPAPLPLPSPSWYALT